MQIFQNIVERLDFSIDFCDSFLSFSIVVTSLVNLFHLALIPKIIRLRASAFYNFKFNTVHVYIFEAPGDGEIIQEWFIFFPFRNSIMNLKAIICIETQECFFLLICLYSYKY